jgi:hypothetical protein
MEPSTGVKFLILEAIKDIKTGNPQQDSNHKWNRLPREATRECIPHATWRTRKSDT